MTQDTRDPFVFASRLFGLLHHGEFTSTYKYAVLLALMDLCVEFNAQGGAPTQVSTRQLAQRVVELYWPHTRSYAKQVLLQTNGRLQVVVISQIAKWQAKHAPAGESFARARKRASFDKLVREVEWKLVQMPLPKLQRAGNQEPFIYAINWGDKVSKGEFNSPSFDNRLLLFEGVAWNLVRVAPLLRPLIHREWAAMVARINGLESDKLEAFLFETASQIDTSAVRPGLLALQGSRCFYCESKLRGDAQVDHFIPRVRHVDHALDNLVVAHAACNGSKSDALAHTDHLSTWTRRLQQSSAQLDAIAKQAAWAREPAKTVNIVQAIYAQVPIGEALWRKPKQWVTFDATARQQAFAQMRACLG